MVDKILSQISEISTLIKTDREHLLLKAEAWVPFVANPESPQTRLDITLPNKATDTMRMKTEECLASPARPNRPSSSDVADDLRNSPASSKVQPKLEDILIPKWKNGSDLNSGWSI